MGFHDVRMPEGITYGAAGGPGFRTSIVETVSGFEQRVARRSRPKHRYNVAYGLKSYSDLAAVREFYVARLGAANSFRFRDWLDCTSTASGLAPELDGPAQNAGDQLIGVGDGSQTQFQLIKRYESGTSTVVRPIALPVSGSVVIAVDNITQSSGWSVNASTGIVTFDTAPAGGDEITAGYRFDVQVRFDEDADALMDVSASTFDAGEISDIGLVEVIDESGAADDVPRGGSYYHGELSAKYSMSLSQGVVQSFDPQSSGLSVILPAESSSLEGGPVFAVVNDSSVNALTVEDDSGNVISTIAVGGTATFWLRKVDAMTPATLEWVGAS